MLAVSSVAYAAERLSESLWTELMPLLQAHWHEVAHYDDIPLDPDRERYEQMDAMGTLKVYTARTEAPSPDRGRLIGYLACFVARSLHYKSSIFATQDVLFVHPDHRGSRTGVGLIAFAHSQLRGEGVQLIFQHVKARGDLNVGPMLERWLGYQKIDEVYGKRLDHATTHVHRRH